MLAKVISLYGRDTDLASATSKVESRRAEEAG
jgi:hypothetical protein